MSKVAEPRGRQPEEKGKKSYPVRLWRNMKAHPLLYIMILPAVFYFLIYHYYPMYGMIISLFDYVPAKGIWGSDFVGLKHFQSFLSDPYFFRTMRNTLSINVLLLVFGFPIPIIFAILLNELNSGKLRRFTQTVTYMPHFISLVVMCGLLVTFSRSDGIFNDFLSLFGMERTNLLANAKWFRPLYVLSGIWQEAGWGSIIYLATLSSIDPGLYEAATIDGANRFQRMIYVSFPGLLPIIIVQLIMRIGNILTTGFEKVFLLYSPLTYETADIISTYIYRQGLELSNYSYGTAVGLFNSIVNLIILVAANHFVGKLTGESLW